jgi:branched-chain amino acid transport system ATP-binding protein
LSVGRLEVRGLRVRYGRASAVRGASFRAEPSTITAIVGPNGAGKSSTLLGVQGVVRASADEISFNGRSLVGVSALQRARAGVVLVPEGRQIFPTLSVEKNLQVVVDGLGLRKTAVGSALERFPILSDRSKQPAGVLSGGEQQMLALARALMCEPSVLLLDEPMQGLAPTIVADVWATLASAREGGTAIVVAAPTTRWLTTIDSGYVMVRGEIVAEADNTRALEEVFLERLARTTSALATRELV